MSARDSWGRCTRRRPGAPKHDVLELPVENLGEWNPKRAAQVLGDHGLVPLSCLVLPPGRELVAANDSQDAIAVDGLTFLRSVMP